MTIRDVFAALLFATLNIVGCGNSPGSSAGPDRWTLSDVGAWTEAQVDFLDAVATKEQKAAADFAAHGGGQLATQMSRAPADWLALSREDKLLRLRMGQRGKSLWIELGPDGVGKCGLVSQGEPPLEVPIEWKRVGDEVRIVGIQTGEEMGMEIHADTASLHWMNRKIRFTRGNE